MKKTLLLTALLMVSTVFAFGRGNNEVQLGGTVGTMYGLDFKVKHKHLAFIADLGVNLFSSPASLDGSKYKLDAFTIELNPNLAYQGLAKDFSALSLDWYIGAGVSGGVLKSIKVINNDDWGDFLGDTKFDWDVKWGANVVAGIDLNLKKIPLTLSFDFRPGYGLIIHTEEFEEDFGIGNVSGVSTTLGQYFDWKLVAGIRYRF